MPRHHQTLAIAAVVILGLCATYLAVRHNTAVGNASSGAGTELPDQEYESVTYGFSFSYPAGSSLNEYASRYIGVTSPESADTVADIHIVFADSEDSSESSMDFAHAQAALMCTSEGATDSVRCPGVAHGEQFTSSRGVVGEVFYLTYESVAEGATTTREAGPFYAYDISHGGAEGPFGIVLIRPSHMAQESAAYDAGALLAQKIADSFGFIGAGE